MTERTIFLSAIEISDPAERAAYVDAACGSDEKLRTDVNSLLNSYARTSQFLETPATSGNPTVDKTVVSSVAGAVCEDNEDSTVTTAEIALREYLQPSSRSGWLGRLAHYEIECVLGSGAFGIVVKAFDEKLQRVVAIKLMNPDLAVTSPPRKRFLREARTAAAVRHENIVGIYAVEEEPLPFLVMEYIPGITLQQQLDLKGPLEIPEILRIGQQVAAGLAAAHAANLIHRDIKPSNILLEGGIENRAKISDFGLARAVDDASMSQSGLIAGTPMYMAPEQARGEVLDHRADLFSLGSVLYQMASGRPPFRASTTIAVLKRVCDDSPRPLQDVIPDVPSWLSTIIVRLLEKKPSDRIQTAKEIAELFARCQAELQLSGKVTCVEESATVPPKALSSSRAAMPLLTAKRRSSRTAILLKVAAPLILIIAVAWLWPAIGLLATGQASFDNLTRDGNTRIDFYANGELVKTQIGFGQIELPAGTYELRVSKPDDDLRIYNAVVMRRNWLRQFEQTTLSSPPQSLRLKHGDRVQFMVAYVRINNSIPTEHITSSSPQSASAGWISLFNGRDLSGWVYPPGEVGNWHVADGVLIGSGSPSYLVSTRDDFSNFHLRCEARINANGDGGVILRAPYEQPGKSGLAGYEVQLQTGEPAVHGWKTGAIGMTQTTTGWKMLQTTQRNLAPDNWVRLEVVVQNDSIETRIADTTVAVYTDLEKSFSTGRIALQQATRETRVEFRNIELRILDSDKTRVAEEPFSWPANAPAPLVAPCDATQAKSHQETWATHLGLPVKYQDRFGSLFVLIPPGEFQMGTPKSEIEKLSRELKQAGASEFDLFVARSSGPQHMVRLTQPWYMAAHEVTVGEYRQFIDDAHYIPTATQLGVKSPPWTESAQGENGEQRAVIGVSWEDATAYCQWRTKRDGVTYELPTEAQWEYACRAGTDSLWSFGDDVTQLSEFAVFNRPSVWPPEVVGTKKPNPFGLFDMYGNAHEWCRDWHSAAFYSQSPVNDPVMLKSPGESASGRVARGGSSQSIAWATRSTTRPWDFPATPVNPKGFRIMITGDLTKVLNLTATPPDTAPEPQKDNAPGGGENNAKVDNVEVEAQ